MKRASIALAASALVVLAVPANSAESHGLTCNVTGAARFSPGVTSEAADFKVAFKGELSDCQSTGEATSATVVAKAKAEDTSCAYGGVTGKGIIKWDDGKKTRFEFSTTDIAAAVILTGEVTKSNDDVAQRGDDMASTLAFNADATKCETKKGLTKVDFQGQMLSGSSD